MQNALASDVIYAPMTPEAETSLVTYGAKRLVQRLLT